MFDSVILYLLLLHQIHSPTGHLILDTGKSGDHEVSHMMPMMGHHFNPYSFYPMQHHQPQAPMIHVHPVYIEDHSAMHHHPEPSHHHEYQHHEEKHYPEHHGMEYQHHHEPHYQEMHHHQMHQEMHHQPEHHEEEQQEQQHHHEPMGHHYEQEAHHEEGGGGHHGASLGYESNPMMQMMMHGSGPQPAYDQLAALQALQHQALYAGPHFQDPASQQYQQHLLQNLHEQKEQQTQLQQDSKPAQAQQQQQQQEAQQQPQQQSNKPTSFFDQAGNNPLIAIIKPIFKRDPNKQKKP